MEALDGNAIGGQLRELFGAEMTTAMSECGSCGATRVVGELVVYPHEMGTVVRCRSCENVLMVLVTLHERTCLDLMGLSALG